MDHWTFPPPANATYLSSGAPTLNSAILQYLNASSRYPPAAGFGSVPTYHADAVRVEWPTNDYVSENRSWHCMPCQIDFSVHETENVDQFSWSDCQYPSNKTLPPLYTVSFPLSASIKYPDVHSSTWNLNHVPSLANSTSAEHFLCTFGIPGTDPYEMTVSFPFISLPREQLGGHMYVFNSSAPGGIELYVPPPSTDRPSGKEELSGDATVGLIVVGVVTFLALFACAGYFWAWRRLSAQIALKRKAHQGDGPETLPAYTAEPPTYAEATKGQPKT